jgi:hypothetical protein
MKVFRYYKEIFTQEDPYIADAFRLDFFNALSGRETNLQDDYLGIDAKTPWYEKLRSIILDNAAQDKIDYDTLPIDWLCLNQK